MHSTPIIIPVELIAVLLVIAATVAMAVKLIKIPYSIALVVVGLLISIFHVLPQVNMTPDLILVVFLPALLFEASWSINLYQLKKNWLAISILSVLGVILSMFIISGVLSLWGQMSLPIALLFGAMISATDPISVLAIFKKLGVNERLTTIMEAESLFNDGTAVTLFQLMFLAVVTNSGYSLIGTIGNFIFICFGGIVVGLIIGFAACKVISFFDDHLLELMLTTLVAYGSLLVAQQLGVSTVMSVVTAGIILGGYGKRVSMSDSTRVTISAFWEYAAFVVNSLVFLLIGLQVNLSLLFKYSDLICISVAALLLSRLAVAYLLIQFVSTKKSAIPLSWRHLLFWGALRGSLSMALALSLPINFPMREKLVILTFGVVLFTLLIQGLTIEPLIKLLDKNNLLKKEV